MSSTIPHDSIERMIAKCGGRCCVCRRFRPTKLEVHRIVEKADGGDDDDDNLIVTCVSCRTDIHSKVPFSRRFSDGELKGNRNTLIALVAIGSLPMADSDITSDVITSSLAKFHTSSFEKQSLLPEAIEILLTAALTDGESQGSISLIRHIERISLLAGGMTLNIGDRRSQAKLRAAVEQLLQCGLLDQQSDADYEVTYDGYLAADEFAVTLANTSFHTLSRQVNSA